MAKAEERVLRVSSYDEFDWRELTDPNKWAMFIDGGLENVEVFKDLMIEATAYHQDLKRWTYWIRGPESSLEHIFQVLGFTISANKSNKTYELRWMK